MLNRVQHCSTSCLKKFLFKSRLAKKKVVPCFSFLRGISLSNSTNRKRVPFLLHGKSSKVRGFGFCVTLIPEPPQGQGKSQIQPHKLNIQEGTLSNVRIKQSLAELGGSKLGILKVLGFALPFDRRWRPSLPNACGTRSRASPRTS